MPRIVTALVLCLSAALLFAACGGGSRVSHDSAEIPAHVIVPQQGMNRLRLGLTEVQVQAKLGEPDARADLLGSEGGGEIVEWRYRRERLELDFRAPNGNAMTLNTISTRDGGTRTAEGIGVGSSERAVRDRTNSSCAPADPGTLWCTIDGGGRETLFKLRAGHVYEVTVTVVFP